MKAVFVLALLGLVAVNSVLGLKCYQCDKCETPKDEKDCTKDTLPDSSATKKEEEANTKYNCYSYTLKENEKDETYRGCTSKTKCDEVKTTVKGSDNCKLCETDNCNPASSVQACTFTSVILVAITKLFV